MTTTVAEILHKIRDLEHQLEDDLDAKRRQWRYQRQAHRIRFERDVQDRHRRLKQNLLRFLRESSLRNLLTAPIIYSVCVPLILLDAWFTIYQRFCFPIYGVPLVQRSRYFVIDRHHLAYLNGIEKLNCVYCGYASSVLAYAREIAGRTEQYWCPIKHSTRVPNPHQRYHLFVDYGDAEGYHDGLPQLRKDYDDVDVDDDRGFR